MHCGACRELEVPWVALRYLRSFTPTRSNPKTGLDAIFLGWRTEKATTTLWAGDHADQYNRSRVHTKLLFSGPRGRLQLSSQLFYSYSDERVRTPEEGTLKMILDSCGVACMVMQGRRIISLDKRSFGLALYSSRVQSHAHILH